MMFTNDRYITRGVQSRIPLDIQALCFSLLADATDYMQVFTFEKDTVIRTEEIDEELVSTRYNVEGLEPVEKVWIIDDGVVTTMLLPEEY